MSNGTGSGYSLNVNILQINLMNSDLQQNRQIFVWIEGSSIALPAYADDSIDKIVMKFVNHFSNRTIKQN